MTDDVNDTQKTMGDMEDLEFVELMRKTHSHLPDNKKSYIQIIFNGLLNFKEKYYD